MAAGKVLVHIGHFGSGKTELSLHAALQYAAEGESTVLVDLDIVNPFFRSGEHRPALEEAGVKVIAPLFVGKTVEVPALPPEVLSVFTGAYDAAVLDVGGDPAGARALGRYHAYLDKADKWVRCVVNAARPFTGTPEDIAAIVREMEERGRIKVDALVNNTNLARETTPEVVVQGERVVLEAAGLLGVPMEYTSVRRDLADGVRKLSQVAVLPIDVRIRPVWL